MSVQLNHGHGIGGNLTGQPLNTAFNKVPYSKEEDKVVV